MTKRESRDIPGLTCKNTPNSQNFYPAQLTKVDNIKKNQTAGDLTDTNEKSETPEFSTNYKLTSCPG